MAGFQASTDGRFWVSPEDEYPDTKLLTVGSAFLDQASGRINGQFRAVPPIWDGHFVILDPLPKRDENGGADPPAEDRS